MPAWSSIAMRHEMRKPAAAFLAGLTILILSALPALAQLPVSSGGATDGNNQRVLPIAEAFPWYVSEAAPGEFRVIFDPAPEHYLYRHAFDFRLQTGAGEQPLEFRLPPGLAKTDQFFPVTSSRITGKWRRNSISSRTFREGAILLIEFQGCADWGFCYPPQQAQFELPSF